MPDQIIEIAKRPKTMKSTVTGNSSTCQVDRISNLPDSLLHDIMSRALVKVRDCVKMSLFSKRWKNLWTTMPYLDVDLKELKEEELEQFYDFVDTMLSSREAAADLHTFRLSCINNRDERYLAAIKRWISYAVQHHVQVLKIDTERIKLPWCIFTCESLEELHLHTENHDWDNHFFDAGAVSLPRLKKLRIGTNIVWLGKGNLEKLVARCTILEHLHLEWKITDKAYCISSQSLKYLTISPNYRGHIESIYAPNLVYFHYFGSARALGIGHRHMPSLSHAEVFPLDTRTIEVHLSQILKGITNVTKLHLCIRKRLKWIYPFDLFPNLKDLYVCGSIDNVMLLLSLGQQLPANLKKLTFWQSYQKCIFHCEGVKVIKWKKDFFDSLIYLETWKSKQGESDGPTIVEIVMSNRNNDDKQKVYSWLHGMDIPNLQVILSHNI